MRTKLPTIAALGCLLAAACGSAAEAKSKFARDLSADVVQSPAHGGSAQGVRLSITSMSGSRVEEGGKVRFRIASNRTGFAHLYVLSASGRLQLWMENVPIRASKALVYPTAPGVTIRAVAPLGQDRIVALLTRKRLDGFNGRQTTDIPMDLDMEQDEFQNAFEGMLAEDERNDWAWARTAVRVVE